MFQIIPNFFSEEQLKELHEIVASGDFVDGRATAKSFGKDVKNNLQLNMKDEESQKKMRTILQKSVRSNMLLQSFAHPLRMVAPTISQYGEGMFYNSHLDSPVMGGGQLHRTDLSMTVFLQDPKEYDGGELVIEQITGQVQKIKLQAGGAVVYNTDQYHRVAEVTRGKRIVLVTWMQSMIADPEMRKVLFALRQADLQLFKKDKTTNEYKLVHLAYNGLLRQLVQV